MKWNFYPSFFKIKLYFPQLESLQQCAAQDDQEDLPYDEPIEDIDLPQNNKYDLISMRVHNF